MGNFSTTEIPDTTDLRLQYRMESEIERRFLLLYDYYTLPLWRRDAVLSARLAAWKLKM